MRSASSAAPASRSASSTRSSRIKRSSFDMLKITVDGKPTEVPPGSMILDAAKQLNIEVPTLCHLDLHELRVNNMAASCRICVVEVEGRKNLAPACATPVAQGMVVKSNTVRVLNARRTVLELML